MSKETLFGLSLFPYLGALWFLTKSQKVPPLALKGFYGTLIFVGITIPSGIFAQVVYNDSLANIDWLHGAAESFLTITNIMVVLGFRQALNSEQLTVNSEQVSGNSEQLSGNSEQ